MKLTQFIAKQSLRMSSEWADKNPNIDSGDWRGASHWKCTIRGPNRRMTVYFSQGAAHTGEPKIADVLDCLASDACTIDAADSFEHWAQELGYDPDSRKAEWTFKACERQTANLKTLLGESAFKQLVYETERL